MTKELEFNKSDKRPLRIFFQDEARYGRVQEPAGCWAPKGIRPLAGYQFIWQYLHVYTAVSPDDGDTFSLILPFANQESMSLFLSIFSKHYKKHRVVMVMDQVAWHKTKN